MHVPFVDLKANFDSIETELRFAINNVLESAVYIRGDHVRLFEEEFAKRYGVNHCISVANGTDAIYITLKALGIGPGDEVITVANTWISTAEAVSQAGATPVFVDIEPDFYHIDPAQIERKITSKTKALLPVHLYGQPAAMKEIKALAVKHGLYLIEDCAQAHFAEYQRGKAGTFGDVATFSFFPTKNLGAFGDAGAITTQDSALATKIRRYANHGALQKHDHEIPGINSRLDALQAAVLRVKLKYVEGWNERRRERAEWYEERLGNLKGIITPKVRPDSSHIFHLYVIRTPRRNELQSFLKERGVESNVHYPTALPLTAAYRHLNHQAKDFPVSNRCQEEILSLPMYPELTLNQLNYVCQQVKEFTNR